MNQSMAILDGFPLVIGGCSSQGWSHLSWFLLSGRPYSEAFDDVEADGDEEDGEHGCRQHSPDDSGSQNPARHGACTRGTPKRYATQNEGEGGHENWPQSQPGSGQRGIGQGFAFLIFGFGKFNNQNGILGRQSDQHDQSDLGIDVVVEPAEVKRHERAEDGNGDAQENAE